MVLSSCFVTVFGRCNVYLRCAYIVTYIYVFVKLHTQHNDVFIRFLFLSVWACLIGRTPRHPAPAAGTICPACLASGRLCRALHLARSALLPVVCRRSGCAGGCGLHRRGIWGEPGVGQASPAPTEKIKKDPPHFHKSEPT